MFPYWLLFGFFAAGALISRAELRERRRLGFMWIAGLIITVMVGLRWEVGADWYSYLNSWKRAGPRSLESYLGLWPGDYAFYILVWSLRETGLPYWALNLACAAIFSSGLVRFSRSLPAPWLAIAVAIPYLVIVVAMSGIRQAAAIGLVFHAMVAFRNRNGAAFLIWIGLASAFHASAILILPLAGLSFTRSRSQAAALLGVTLLIAYYTLGAAFDRYSIRYLDATVIESGGTLFRIIMNLVAATIYLLVGRRLPLEPREWTLWRNFSLVAVASLPAFLFIASSTALDRVLLYLVPLQMVVLASLPLLTKKALESLLLVSLTILYLGGQLFVFLNYAVNRHSYIPYEMVSFFD